MAKSLEKTILHAAGKVDGKAKMWIVAVFNDRKAAQPFAAMLKVHHASGNVDAVRKMDPSVPVSADGKLPVDVKFSASQAPYSPEVADLDDADILG